MIASTFWVEGFLLGLGSAAHCAGMCGVFAVQATGLRRGRTAAGRVLAWWAGKYFSYLFIGTLAGLFGQEMLASAPRLQGWLGLLTALMILTSGVFFLMGPAAARGGTMSRLVAPVFAAARAALGRGGPFALGVLTGLLPCGPVYVAALNGAAGGHALTVVAMMSSLALGTLPILLLVGLAGRGIIERSRGRIFRIAGFAAILAAGALALYRALPKILMAYNATGVPPCCH